MYPNQIKKKIATGKPVLGTALFTRESHIAATIFSCAPDWVWIDQEHTPWGTESIGMICVQARQSGVAGVIRVPWNTPGDIKKAYDVGAVGVMVPQVDTSQEARDAVKYSRYPPLGERGIAPFFASIAGIDPNEVTLKSNDETLLILQMESKEAWENIDEIIEVENFDVLLAGPADLSASLGVPTQIHHPEVAAIMEQMPRKLEGTGKVAGTTFARFEDCIRWIDKGYQFMNIGSLLNYGAEVQRAHFDEVRSKLL